MLGLPLGQPGGDVAAHLDELTAVAKGVEPKGIIRCANAARCVEIPNMERARCVDGVTLADLTRIGDALLSAVDPVHGGLRGAPKFPNAPIFRFFWSEMFRRGDPRFGAAVRAMVRNKVDYLPIDQIEGRIATTLFVVYPPGIATIVPGERIDERSRPMLDYLKMFERAANLFPGFESEIQGVYREVDASGAARFHTYVVRE